MAPNKDAVTSTKRGPGRPRKIVDCNELPTPQSPPPAPPVPTRPTPPVLPFKCFSNKWWTKVQDEHPELDCLAVNSIICAKWYDLSTAVRQEYIDDFVAGMWIYKKALTFYEKAMHAQAKAKNKPEEVIDYVKPKSNRFVAIESNEGVDGKAEEIFSTKHLSMARMMMNDHLITQILSPSVSDVSKPMSLDVLKYQVNVLEHHIGMEQDNLVQLEEKHKSKMQQIMQAETEFNEQANCWSTYVMDADGTSPTNVGGIDMEVEGINVDPLTIEEEYFHTFNECGPVPLEPSWGPPYSMEYDEDEPVILCAL